MDTQNRTEIELTERSIQSVQFEPGAGGDLRSKVSKTEEIVVQIEFSRFLLLGEQDNSFSRTPLFVFLNPTHFSKTIFADIILQSNLH
jgi:hypothetical protein